MPRASRTLLPSASASLIALALASATLVPAGAARAQGPPAAQAPPPSPAPASPAEAVLGTYKWRSIGPDRGGRSIAVSGVKGRPIEGYFGAVGGGLWKTTDAGNNWTPVTDGQIDELVGGRGGGVRDATPTSCSSARGILHPRQHHARRRRLQVGRRRQDVDARRLPQRRGHRQDPHPSDQSRGGLRGRLRQLPRAERRARRVQEQRRRQDRGRRCSSATARPAPSTCRSIARTPT